MHELLLILPLARAVLFGNVAPYPLMVPLWEALAGAAALALILLLAYRLLRTKYFFFVRHGETLLNAGNIRQGESGSLSERGIAQAEAAGAFLAHFRIRTIFASPYQRTRETAHLLKGRLHCRVRYSALLEERHNPSEIIGRSGDDPAIKHILDLIDLSFHDDNFRYSDEENFTDLKRRARRALGYLKRRGGARNAVVTHKIFLHMILAYLEKRERLHAADWVGLSFFNPADNAGVTLCAWQPLRCWNRTRGWQILTINATAENPSGPARGKGALALNLLRKN